MDENKKRVNFDLKELEYKQVIETFTYINDFINFLNEAKIVEEEENDDE